MTRLYLFDRPVRHFDTTPTFTRSVVTTLTFISNLLTTFFTWNLVTEPMLNRMVTVKLFTTLMGTFVFLHLCWSLSPLLWCKTPMYLSQFHSDFCIFSMHRWIQANTCICHAYTPSTECYMYDLICVPWTN